MSDGKQLENISDSLIKRCLLLFLTCFLFTLFAANKQVTPFEEYLKHQNYETWLPSYISSSEIHLYQRTLLVLGYDPGPIDGILGAKTIKAIKNFQRDNKLVPDGIVGNKTREAFILSLYSSLYPAKENQNYLLKSNYQLWNSVPYVSKNPIGSQEYKRDYKGRLVPSIAENGSYYGQISKATGRPKVVYVEGYYRKDGTYVRSYYRSRPRR